MALVVGAAAAAAVVLDLPARADLTVPLLTPESVTSVRRTVESAGRAAPLVFMVLYVGVTLAPVPKNLLSALAGLLFGLVPGILLVLAAALLGALIAFALGRMLGRAAVERFASRRVRDVDALLARRGLLAVVVVRLVPVVPFTVVNYAAGLTGVRLRDYTLGTAVGIVPGTVAYVTLGSYGGTPGAWPFVASAAGLAALSAGGLVAARRGRSGADPRGR